ncbi:MAG: hypothetical protein HGA65_11145 [Oscillochloris sp.]|nr:hypothetical protein [Oscillochloris sp.]
MASSSLRTEVQLLIGHLTEIGTRRAGSPQEATAAAFINARLRRAGMGVSTQPLQVSSRRRRLYGTTAACGLFAALTAILLPTPALVLALAAAVILVIDATRGPLTIPGPRHASQTIIGTQAIAALQHAAPRLPRWRVLLLAPLDSSMATAGIAALAGPSFRVGMARLGALLLVALAAWLHRSHPERGWVLLVIPAVIVLALQIVAVLRGPALAQSDGSICALTTLLLAAQQLHDLQHVEIWAVALGSTSIDPASVEDLLGHYPFEPDHTLVIALDHLVAGQLCLAMNGRYSDQSLVKAISTSSLSLQIPIDLSPPLARLALTSALRHATLPTLTFYTLDGPSCRADPKVCEAAACLIKALVAQLEAIKG